YQQRDLIGITALERAANRVELVAQSLDRCPDPLFGLLADASGGGAVVEDIRNRGKGDVGGSRYVFNRRPGQYQGLHLAPSGRGYYPLCQVAIPSICATFPLDAHRVNGAPERGAAQSVQNRIERFGRPSV